MHFSLIKLTPGGRDAAANGFDDVILPVYYALRRLGFTAVNASLTRPDPSYGKLRKNGEDLGFLDF
jgi:hypothetical protein